MSSQQGFGDNIGVSGRMGDQDITRGWLLAFSAEGFESELPFLEEIGVNWGHIKMKVSWMR